MGTVNLPDKIARAVEDLPVLSTVATRLLQVTGDENHSMNEVVRVIEVDAILTSKVLRISNSAAFSRGKDITSLPRAIGRLGEKIVTGIVIGESTKEVFVSELEGYEADAGDLWDHSLRTALAARELSKFSKENVSSDEAFTAGLLHDIGKSVIDQFLAGKATKMRKHYDDGEADDFRGAERDQVGTDHAEVGFALAARWSLPDALAEVIRNHHDPSEAKEEFKHLTYVVHLGDFIAMMAGTGTGADTLAYNVDQQYADYFNLRMKDIDNLILTVEMEFTDIKNFVVPSGNADES